MTFWSISLDLFRKTIYKKVKVKFSHMFQIIVTYMFPSPAKKPLSYLSLNDILEVRLSVPTVFFRTVEFIHNDTIMIINASSWNRYFNPNISKTKAVHYTKSKYR